MVDWGDEFSFARVVHVKIYVRIDISTSITSMTTKFDHLNETNEVNAGDVIKSRSNDNEKHFISTNTLPMA